MAVNVNIDCGKMSNLTKRLLGSSLMPDLIAHFNNSENQKKFEKWRKERELVGKKEIKGGESDGAQQVRDMRSKP